MNFGNVIEWNIPEGSVEEVRETKTGRIIWQGMISAIYHDHIPYTLTYYPNFETTQKISTDIFYSDEPYPIQPCYYERDDGYVFESWNDKSDGTGKKYLINDELERSSDYQLYAQWLNGILMIYRDSDGKEKIHKFSLSELPNPFRITDYLSPYPLVEPFSTILNGDRSKIISFFDSNGEIKEVGERGIIKCPNIENIHLPGVTTLGSYTFIENSKLKNLTLTRTNNLQSSYFSGAQLTYCKIDSEKLVSYPNTDKGVDVYNDQLICEKRQTGLPLNITAIANMCKTIDRDDIEDIRAYVVNYSDTLTSMNVPNLTGVQEGPVFPFHLQNIYINNNTLSCCNDDPENQNNYIVGNKGTKLIKALACVKHIKNNNITSFQNWWMEQGTQLTSVEINNDYVQSVANNTALISKDGKTLIRVLPTTSFTPKNYPAEYSKFDTLNGECFIMNRTIDEIDLPNITKITGYRTILFNDTRIKRFSLNNLEQLSGDISFWDHGPQLQYVSLEKFTTITNQMFGRSGTSIELTELTINMPNATTIGSTAFRQHCGIRNLAFDKVTSVGKQAFERCMNLQTISLNSCTSFGDNSFNDCVYIDGGQRKTHLTDIYCNAVTKSYIQNNRTRIGFPSGCTCHCSDGDYKIP